MRKQNEFAGRDIIVPGQRVSFTVTTPTQPGHLMTGVVRSVDFDYVPEPMYRVRIDGTDIRLNLTRRQIEKIVKLS